MIALERHIIKHITYSTILVVLVLTVMQIFILFVNQLGDINRGDFNLIKAFYFILLELPYQLYLFFPMACLLGTLIGLGILANQHELIIMRSAGMSILRIAKPVFKISILFVIFMYLVGETIIPKLNRIANDYKYFALHRSAFQTNHGIWLKQDNSYLRVGKINYNKTLLNILEFKFNNDQLQLVRNIQMLKYRNKQWHAYNVMETQILKDKINTISYPSMIWHTNLATSLLKNNQNEINEMSLLQLGQFLLTQKKQKKAINLYELVFWQRCSQPLSTLVMILLAIPFIFGPLRSSTMGSKVLIGAACGFCYHILSRFLAHLSMVLQFSAVFAAFAPILIFTLIGFYLIKNGFEHAR